MPTVLVVDDDRAVRDALERALRLDGYEVLTAPSGLEALRRIATSDPDVVVLDVTMPGPDGLAVTRRLRHDGDRRPILMLTARDAVDDRVDGLDAGADDYLVKPFALDELRARLRALLRRGLTDRDGDAPAVLRLADLTLDTATMEVRRGGRPLDLTRTEHLLLELLMDNPRIVLTRETIMDRVWGFDAEATSNVLEVYVGYLRRKLEAGGEPRLLHTVRGVGYALREP